MAAHNLPTFPTSFIGRADEITELDQLLDDSDCRLLTLVGPGGIGKTRLAVEIAARKVDNFPDGMYFVPLQPLQFADHLLPAIMDVLQLKTSSDPKEGLLRYLSDKQLLWVLDNFDHVSDGTELVSDVLGAAPGVKILVSSRETLKLQHEWVRRVSGLDYPADDSAPQADVYSAVQLFAERARRVRDGFSLADEGQDVIRICRLVDGIPLALELAAGWTKLLSCREIAEEIEHDLGFLSTTLRDIPAQHQSMRVVLDRSWQRLAAAECAVFGKLCIFRGGFDRNGATQVAGATLMDLASLAAQSWLRAEGGGRYGIQEVLRQYGLEKLEAAGDLEAGLSTHCAYYAEFMKRRETAIKSDQQDVTLSEIRADSENIRLAWQWAVDHHLFDQVDRMIECLYWYYWSCGSSGDWSLLHNSYDQLAPLLQPESHPLWAKLAVRAGAHNEEQIKRLEKAVEAARGHDDTPTTAAATQYLAFLEGWVNHDYETGIRLYQECLITYRDLNDHFALTDVHTMIGQWLIALGKLGKAQEHLSQAFEMAAEHQDGMRTIVILLSLGEIALYRGDCDQDFAYASQAARIQRDNRTSLYDMRCKGGLSVLAFFCGDFATARTTAEAMQRASLTIRYEQDDCYWRTVLGLMGCMDADYRASSQFLAEDAVLNVYPAEPVEYLAHLGLAITAYGLSDDAGAKAHLVEILKFALKARAVGLMTWCLPVAALLIAHDARPQGATELVGLAFTHPASLTGWLERWPLFVQFLDELEAGLGTNAYQAACERGTQLDLEVVAAELLVKFTKDTAHDPRSSNDGLIEPLTPREMDVLRLVAEGHSDREIADSLVLAPGTIKKYGAVIRQKLAAQNRTHAVTIARELGLI